MWHQIRMVGASLSLLLATACGSGAHRDEASDNDSDLRVPAASPEAVPSGETGIDERTGGDSNASLTKTGSGGGRGTGTAYGQDTARRDTTRPRQ
jgi:hypothetical protein